MGKFVLIVTIAMSHYSGGVSGYSQEFNGENQCKAAGGLIEKQVSAMQKMKPGAYAMAAMWSCVKK